MGRTTLLISRRHPFPATLLNFYLERGDTLYLATPGDDQEAQPEAEGYRRIPWNPRSPISARNVLLTLENSGDAADEALLLFEHGEESRPLHQVAGSIIDLTLDTALRGSLFICKELLSSFDRYSAGRLNLVLAGYPGAVRPSLEAAMEGALREMGNAMFQVYRESAIRIRGFEDRRENREEFYGELTTLFERDDEKSWGRWNRPGERGGIFSVFGR